MTSRSRVVAATVTDLGLVAATAILIILGAGFIATEVPRLADVIEQGIALGTQMVGFVVIVGSLFKGGQVLRAPEFAAPEARAVGFTAITGTALLVVGQILGS